MEVRRVECKTAASRSGLPGLDWAVNPYRGCSHGCAYCYAQDVTRFETSRPWGEVVEVKVNIVSKLESELAKRSTGVYGIGTVTDPYQPVEREYELTRGCLELLKKHRASVSILTKSDLVLRDMDLIAACNEAEVGISVGSSDQGIASMVEPGAPSPERRFHALRALSAAGISTYLMMAPLIPGISDSQENIASVFEHARNASVKRVIWDKFNSKPIATSRLKKTLQARGLIFKSANSTGDLRALQDIVRRECVKVGLDLSDAF